MEHQSPSLAENVPARLLAKLACEIYVDPRLIPMLNRLATISRQVMRAEGSSVSLVDSTGHRYLKVAEHGTPCMLGQSFPVTEGMTGRTLADRRPVLLARYGEIERGHMPDDHPAWNRSALAVPVWWQGQVVGANVVFGGPHRRFTRDEVEQLDALTAAAVPGIVTAGATDPSLRHLIRSSQPARGRVCPLSPRETEVAGLLARGLDTRAIALSLGLSPKTVEKHVGKVINKTRTANRTGAVAVALEAGWIS